MAELVITKDNFEAEVINSDIPVLVDFWAEWCGPCRMAGPLMSEIAAENEGKLKVGKVNVDSEPELAEKFSIFSIPTVIGFRNGEVTNRLVGLNSKSAYVKLVL